MLIPVVWYSALYLTSFSYEPLYQGQLVLDCYLAAYWYCHTPAIPKPPIIIAMAFQWWYHCAGNVYENIMSNVSFQWMTWQSYIILKWLWTIINHIHMCLCALLCAFKCVCLCVCVSCLSFWSDLSYLVLWQHLCSCNYIVKDKTDMARFTNMKKTKHQ